MSFCSNCGAEVKEGQAICLSCGFALKGNAAAAENVLTKDYSNRVKHDAFRLWPKFDGPVGRMDYFVSLLKLCAVGIAAIFITSLFGAAVETNSGYAMTIPLMLFSLVSVIVLLLIVVHQIALVYKRFWDMGFEDNGTRVGMTIGYFIVSMIPILNLAVFAMFFVPGKGKQ
jgi:uncharacterized membrane protein YhaH (DUF805 family)